MEALLFEDPCKQRRGGSRRSWILGRPDPGEQGGVESAQRSGTRWIRALITHAAATLGLGRCRPPDGRPQHLPDSVAVAPPPSLSPHPCLRLRLNRRVTSSPSCLCPPSASSVSTSTPASPSAKASSAAPT
jgi:hypothetical protein